MQINSDQEQFSVTETVTMYAVRKIGKSAPLCPLTYFVYVAEEWKEEGENLEIVVVKIKPYNGEKRK